MLYLPFKLVPSSQDLNTDGLVPESENKAYWCEDIEPENKPECPGSVQAK